jgi:hypothetical protein
MARCDIWCYNQAGTRRSGSVFPARTRTIRSRELVLAIAVAAAHGVFIAFLGIGTTASPRRSAGVPEPVVQGRVSKPVIEVLRELRTIV